MKKFIKLAIVAVLALSIFAGCASKPSNFEGKDLTETVKDINSAVEFEAMIGEVEIANTDDFVMSEAFLGIDKESFDSYVVKAVVSEPMMGSIGHSTAIIQMKDAKSAELIQKMVYDNINMRKWICVNADRLYVGVSGEYVYMVMSDVEIADKLIASFEEKAGVVGDTFTRDFEG